jgi:hypothetical protein
MTWQHKLPPIDAISDNAPGDFVIVRLVLPAGSRRHKQAGIRQMTLELTRIFAFFGLPGKTAWQRGRPTSPWVARFGG